ncbi:MAG: hypothetical protein EpisKO_15780 [Epibacterium sp.]
MTPCPIATFARTLLALPANERRDSFATAVIEAGGSYDFLNAPGAYEVQLHGFSGFGMSEDSAICEWAEEVLKNAAEVEEDGFITVYPRPQQVHVPPGSC